MIHQGRVDAQGNYRNLSRKEEGYFDTLDGRPFAALVTAWHPKSQTIDVVVPVQYAPSIELDEITVYGNFFESTGTIYTPKIATTLGADGYTTVEKQNPNSDQNNPDSEEYVLNNHIEALIFETNSGEFATNFFRVLSADSQMLNNVKEGRKITRHDDGSYKIHDEDGSIQFKHPSGLSYKIGKDNSDIELDEPFDEHAKNEQDYGDSVVVEFKIPSDVGEIVISFDGTGSVKLDHPTGSIFEITDLGLFEMNNTLGTVNLKKLHDDMATIVSGIVTNGGTNPNPVLLTQFLTDVATLLK